MKIRISSGTDTGIERSNNEDNSTFLLDLEHLSWGKNPYDYISLGKYGSIALIADGMGGADAGEVASAIAVDSFAKFINPEVLDKIIFLDDLSILDFLKENIAKINLQLLDHMTANPNTIGMGTTFVVIWILNGKAYIAWCGDSRCYLFNPYNGLIQLTKDHSFVQSLIDKGEIKEEDSFNHPDSNIITRYLGDFDSFQGADALVYNISENDNFLLCSDGLSGYCDHTSIQNCISTHYNCPDDIVRNLIQMAIDRGGYDNITVQYISLRNDSSPNVGNITQKFRHFLGLD